MARLAGYELTTIKSKILKDLYGEAEKALNIRRVEITKQNRQYYLEPLKPIFDKLPPEMIPLHSDYHLKINYNARPVDTGPSVIEIWKYKSDTPIINPHDISQQYGHISMAIATLDNRLKSVAAKLCKDILALQLEKDTMYTFLEQTTNKYSGSLQLRKIWPETLHHYLPKELARTKNGNSSKETAPVFITPTDLKTRLTTNLLEGS